MRSQSIYHYILFGTDLRYLQDAQSGWSIHNSGAILSNIDAFLGFLRQFELPVTQRAANELVALAEKFRASAPDSNLSTADCVELKRIMNVLRPTLMAEARGNVAFVVSDKRYEIEKLMSNVGALMAPGVMERLPIIAQSDFSEAGMCIAFVRPTAAAFHLLRATEAVLRQLYRGVVRQRRIAKPWMWGPVVNDMRGRRNAPTGALIHSLDGLREHFRNPTQHPEKVYDIDEAQDLFAACIDVVNRMVATDRWIDP